VDEMRPFLAIHFSTRSFFLFLYSKYNRIIVQYIKINVIRPRCVLFFPPEVILKKEEGDENGTFHSKADFHELFQPNILESAECLRSTVKL
jgi:hypothetical protein